MDHVEEVNCTPCRMGWPDLRLSGGSTQTMEPSTVRGPLGACRIISSAVPGDRSRGRRSCSPERLIFPVRPSRVAPGWALGWHVTARSNGQRTPPCCVVAGAGFRGDADPLREGDAGATVASLNFPSPHCGQ